MKLHKKAYNQFLLTYIFVILLFAVIYTLMSNQFYYSLSQYEKIFNMESKQIIANLEQSIKDNFIKNYSEDIVLLSNHNDKSKEYIFNIKDLKVDSIEIQGETLIINNDIIIRKVNDPIIEYKTTVQLKVFHEDKILYDNLVYRICEISLKNEGRGITYLNNIDLKPIFEMEWAPRDGVAGVVLTEKLNEQIETYLTMNDGKPSLVKGNIIHYFKWNFPRMLYLSMVTITTLGYGDIVPLTNTARILIGLESTMGIIILGWFCNKIMRVGE